MQRLLVLVVWAILNVFTLMLIAGHGPWAGRTIWVIDARHGLNIGDVPVLAGCLLGWIVCGVLFWRVGGRGRSSE